ncbi:T6SS immunity protein Tli3 family protein [Caballeronia zhejiangensis]|uniref:Tli3-like domain-containing protein n=1 Tax=Caballeronia zhejiangensis TaxID=871203 RepID=A0A656QH24_9BURK|nr:hypothetical protein BG60_22700 [Caballeronia zhejiangensis]
MLRRFLVGFLIIVTFAGCEERPVAETNLGANASATGTRDTTYSVPPQVVYRVDDHRFITLENYNDCSGDTWYNDTKSGVRTKIGLTWPAGFRGELVVDDPTGMNVVIPTVSTNLCGDRGCINYLAYSSDGGRSFNWLQYDDHAKSFDSVKSSGDYLMSVTKDSLYITQKISDAGDTYTDRVPLAPGYVYGQDAKLPKGVGIESDAQLPRNLATPSGQKHYACDNSIHDSKATKK